ncbi:MAG: hypothetical protein EOO48_06285 [Flavobacterium sp.]|nr:MAG: hypothetical protein EOO48_06285 [Flavobacterium sp.]
MKKLLYTLTGLLLMISYNSNAQSSETIDIATQIANDDSILAMGTRYYFYPNLDAYYDSKENVYIFESNTAKGQILKAKEVPSGYRGYSLYNGIRVAITDYDGDDPFSKISEHRRMYPKKYASKRQPPKTSKVETNIALN